MSRFTLFCDIVVELLRSAAFELQPIWVCVYTWYHTRLSFHQLFYTLTHRYLGIYVHLVDKAFVVPVTYKFYDVNYASSIGTWKEQRVW